jgi:hypothetical protein
LLYLGGLVQIRLLRFLSQASSCLVDQYLCYSS